MVNTKGIGRREFLRLTSIAFAGLAIDPLKAVAINENIYVNKKLGILFHKPQDWGFIAIKDFGKLKSEQIIGEGLDQTPEQLWEELGDPICVATKYYQDKPEYKGIFSPTITLNITPKEELDDVGCETFEELMEMSAYGTSMILKDFRVIKKYDPYYISNCKVYECDAEYLFEHIEINEPQSKAQQQFAQKEFEDFKKNNKALINVIIRAVRRFLNSISPIFLSLRCGC